MKRKLFFDTSILVAALVQEHPHHVPAAAVLNGVFTRRERAFVSAHGLVELYAVLTRAPEPLLISPGDAWRMIEASLLPWVEPVALTGDEYREVLEEGGRLNLTGGRIYDLIHIRAAQKVGCTRLYTFNVKHFRSMAPATLQDTITSP